MSSSCRRTPYSQIVILHATVSFCRFLCSPDAIQVTGGHFRSNRSDPPHSWGATVSECFLASIRPLQAIIPLFNHHHSIPTAYFVQLNSHAVLYYCNKDLVGVSKFLSSIEERLNKTRNTLFLWVTVPRVDPVFSPCGVVTRGNCLYE